MSKTNPPIVIDVQSIPSTEEVQQKVNAFEAGLAPLAVPVITTPAMYVDAGEALKRNKTDQASLAEELNKIIGPLNQAVKATRELFKPAQDRLLDVELGIKSRVLDWNRQVEKQRAETQAKLDQEAREREAAAEARAKKLEKAGKVEQAEAVRDNVLPAAIVQMATPKVAGIAERTEWHAEVTDLTKLIIWAVEAEQLEAFILPNEKALGAYARSMKGNAKIPGVRIWSTKGIAAGKA